MRRRAAPPSPRPEGPSPFTRAALGATCHALPRQPWYLGSSTVVANVYRDGFRPPGCLAAAVVDLPERRPPGLWLVACYQNPDDPRRPRWVEGYLGERVEALRVD